MTTTKRRKADTAKDSLEAIANCDRPGRAGAFDSARPPGPADRTTLSLPSADKAPSAAETKAIEAAQTAFALRRPRTAVTLALEDGVLKIGPPHSDVEGFSARLATTFGTSSLAFIHDMLGRLNDVLRARGASVPTEDALNAAIAAVDGFEPADEIEAMLAVQMVATNRIALEALSRANRSDTLSQMKENGAFATKLLRAYAAQAEAMARLKRGGVQDVRVIHQHVNVEPGAQAAIVGAVEKRADSLGPGGAKK